MVDSEGVKSLIQITQLQFPNMHIMLKTSLGKTQNLGSIWSHATVVMVGEWEESIIVPPYLMFGAKLLNISNKRVEWVTASLIYIKRSVSNQLMFWTFQTKFWTFQTNMWRSYTIIDLCQKKRWQFAGSCSSSDSSPKIFAKHLLSIMMLRYLQSIC